MTSQKRDPLRQSIGPLLVLAIAACGILRPAGKNDPLRALVAEGDVLYHQRASQDQLEAALERYKALACDYEDPVLVTARIARAHYSLAYGYQQGKEALGRYETGREAAWRCLAQDAGFAGVVAARGGKVGRTVANRVGPERLDCLLWLVGNWSRWLELRDTAAASLDLEPLLYLSDRALELADGEQRGLALHFAGLTHALAPKPLNPDLVRAEELLLQANAQDPQHMTVLVDLAQLVYLRQDEAPRAAAILERVLNEPAPRPGDKWELENKRAQERARQLLGEELEG